MAIATNAMKEALSTAYGTNAVAASMHTGAPGTTGANEATGGGYARQALTWTSGSADGVNTAAQVTFTLAAGTYTDVGIWSATSAGTFYDSYHLPTAITLSVAGSIQVTPTFTEA